MPPASGFLPSAALRPPRRTNMAWPYAWRCSYRSLPFSQALMAAEKLNLSWGRFEVGDSRPITHRTQVGQRMTRHLLGQRSCCTIFWRWSTAKRLGRHQVQELERRRPRINLPFNRAHGANHLFCHMHSIPKFGRRADYEHPVMFTTVSPTTWASHTDTRAVQCYTVTGQIRLQAAALRW